MNTWHNNSCLFIENRDNTLGSKGYSHKNVHKAKYKWIFKGLAGQPSGKSADISYFKLLIFIRIENSIKHASRAQVGQSNMRCVELAIVGRCLSFGSPAQ